MAASRSCHFMGPPSARASSGVLAGSSAFSWPNKQKEKVRRKWHTVTLPSFHLSEDSHVTPCNHRGGCECRLSVRSGRGDGAGKHLGCLCRIHYRPLRGPVCSQFSILRTLVYLCLFTKWTPPFSQACPARFQIGFESDLQVAFLNCPNENELVPFPISCCMNLCYHPSQSLACIFFLHQREGVILHNVPWGLQGAFTQ